MEQYYKWMGFLFLMLWLSTNSLEARLKEDLINYRVTASHYTFSTVFDMASDKCLMGSVVKSMFNIKTHYEAYDRFGLYEGQGICRFLCLGLFYTWGTEIDIYDANGNRIGIIDGQMVSSEPAKFSFYDDAGNRVAIGYLDQNCMGFSLIDPDPNNPRFVLARLTRNFILDTIDNWDIVIYYPDRISPQLIKIFAAFVCDTQNKFKPDL